MTFLKVQLINISVLLSELLYFYENKMPICKQRSQVRFKIEGKWAY